jgi:hypothetical protein
LAPLVRIAGSVSELDVDADRLAVFDLATEEWKLATLRALTSSLLASMDDEEEDDKLIMPPYRSLILLRRKHCQLPSLDESLVVLYFNVKNG